MSQQEIIDALKVLKVASAKEIAELKNMSINTTRHNIHSLIKNQTIKISNKKSKDNPRVRFYELISCHRL